MVAWMFSAISDARYGNASAMQVAPSPYSKTIFANLNVKILLGRYSRRDFPCRAQHGEEETWRIGQGFAPQREA